MTPIDALDARLLLALDDDPDATILSLAQGLGVARNTVHARLRRLTAGGALAGFSRRVDPVALGYSVVAFVSIAISQAEEHLTMLGLQGLPEVVEIHSITGDYDLLMKVVARDTADLHRITSSILTIDGVARTNTSMSLAEEKPLSLRGLLEVAGRA